jgi:hypothetical protein
MKGSAAAGLGGISNTLYWPVRLEFPGGALQLDVYAGFSASMDAIGAGFGLLGQCGFFDRVNISFNQRDGTFIVEVDQAA